MDTNYSSFRRSSTIETCSQKTWRRLTNPLNLAPQHVRGFFCAFRMERPSGRLSHAGRHWQNHMSDVRMHSRGSLVGFEPVSESAKDWFAENVYGWQRLGDVLWVEQRLAGHLVAVLTQAGLQVE